MDADIQPENPISSDPDTSGGRPSEQEIQKDADVEKYENEKNETKGREQEKRTVTEEEQKDVEKPLLDDKETVSIDLGTDEKNLQGSDLPTLPLPEKKKPLPDVDMTIIDDTADRPPMFEFPMSRLRFEWKNSSSCPEFFGRAICIIFVTLGWAFFSGGVPLISVVMLIMGSVYKNDCPYEPRIPSYLIVAGFFGTLQLVCKVCYKLMPERYRGLLEAHKRKFTLLEGLMQLFLFIWFILGCVWVYRIFEPEYDNPLSPEFCNKSVYLFAFWIFNLTFIILCCLLIFSFCIILIVASSSKD